ncbi:MAG: flavodoxin family protein [Deltaproteobacteria bacterium]|jgi:multimeric flavodoxin WrbA|nr:flavodoxin family protein [Deltaproteobacteria bacterium]
MKVAVILGSPRVTSNSTQLAEAAVKASGADSSEVSKFHLNSLNIKGCHGCFSCKTKTEVCVIKDDLAKVLTTAAQADLVVLTAPIYIGEITAQQKIFIDRTFSWFKPDFKSNSVPGRLSPGRKLLFIVTQGNPDSSAYKKNVDAYVGYFRAQNFTAESFIVAGLGGDDVTVTKPEAVLEAEKAVTSLLKS